MKLTNLLKTKYAQYAEIIRYLIIGVLTTIVSLGVYYACTLTFLNPDDAFQLQVANVLSWVISVLFAYFTNRSFVFKIKDSHILSELFKFVASRIFTLLLDMGLMFLLVTLANFDDKIIKILVQALVIILNYVLSKFLVFIKPQKTSEKSLESPKNP